jgi:lipopolysaccharide/colanic/teichoic acid biosynthesis glycosyltransferase
VEELLQRVALDLEYIERWSLLMDLKILLITPYRLLQGEDPRAATCKD